MDNKYKVIINGYVDSDDISIDECKERALSYVNSKDVINDVLAGEDVVTKVYYISPSLGKIFVTVTEEDRQKLGVDSRILADTNIAEYPLVKLPSKIVEYKELIITSDSELSDEEVLAWGQKIADDAFELVKPFKIPVVKVIDYRNSNPSQIIMPSTFGDNKFLSSDAPIVEGDKNLVEFNYTLDITGDGACVAYYPFDDETPRDIIGNFDATWHGTPKYANAPKGKDADLVYGQERLLFDFNDTRIHEITLWAKKIKSHYANNYLLDFRNYVDDVFLIWGIDGNPERTEYSGVNFTRRQFGDWTFVRVRLTAREKPTGMVLGGYYYLEDGNPRYAFGGYIDNVRVFTRHLTDEEVDRIFEAEKHFYQSN